jgi:NhaP-type Na+/H+ or K+/H+ antiporter
MEFLKVFAVIFAMLGAFVSWIVFIFLIANKSSKTGKKRYTLLAIVLILATVSFFLAAIFMGEHTGVCK